MSACIGTPQNYLVYTNSVLFIRSGGESRTAGIMLGLAILAFFLFGGSLVMYVPTIVVGALIFHLSIELVKEALVDPISRGISRHEYATILAICFIMAFVGFTEG
jgi:SulP family sulfate permease